MKKQNKIPESWSLCWSLLAVQRSKGMGNKARTFTSLTTLAAAAGCGSHVPRAFAALGYIARGSSGRWWPITGAPDWSDVRQWIAEQRGRAVKKTPPTPDPLPALTLADFSPFARHVDTPDILDNREVVEMALRIHRAGYNVKVWKDDGGGVTSLELKA
jgi:hypothetical protein